MHFMKRNIYGKLNLEEFVKSIIFDTKDMKSTKGYKNKEYFQLRVFCTLRGSLKLYTCGDMLRDGGP